MAKPKTRPCRGRPGGEPCPAPVVRYLEGPGGTRTYFCDTCQPAHVASLDRLRYLPGCEPQRDAVDQLLAEIAPRIRDLVAPGVDPAELGEARAQLAAKAGELHALRNDLTARQLELEEVRELAAKAEGDLTATVLKRGVELDRLEAEVATLRRALQDADAAAGRATGELVAARAQVERLELLLVEERAELVLARRDRNSWRGMAEEAMAELERVRPAAATVVSITPMAPAIAELVQLPAVPQLDALVEPAREVVATAAAADSEPDPLELIDQLATAQPVPVTVSKRGRQAIGQLRPAECGKVATALQRLAAGELHPAKATGSRGSKYPPGALVLHTTGRVGALLERHGDGYQVTGVDTANY